MKTWIAGDCGFLERPDKDSVLIDKWNKNVDEYDEVLVLGNFFYKVKIPSFENKAKVLLRRLKGTISIMDYDEQKYNAWTRDKLKEIGFARVNNIYCFSQNGNRIVHIIPTAEKLDCFKGKLYGAGARSTTGKKGVWTDNVLSISIADWGYAPIEYDNLPNLVDNMIMFSKIQGE